MSVTWQGSPADQRCRTSWQEWEANLLRREREWEKRKRKNWTRFIAGLLPYAAVVIVGAAIWCLWH